MNLLRELIRLDFQKKNKIATVIAGEGTGNKAVLVDREYQSIDGDPQFWEEVKASLLTCNETTIMDLKGSRIFLEYVKPQPKLVICGGGHVSIPIIQMANMLEFEVTVLEDRPVFADNARRAGAANVICESFEKGMEQIAGDSNTYFVIVTRGHRYDTLCLLKALNKSHAYVGMMGSKARVHRVKEILLEQGVDAKTLDQVYTPIGLKIKAETPAEIAVSILSEIIKVKNEISATTGYSREILSYLEKNKESKIPLAMVTIISRRGSAPRKVGTKMLIARDGSMAGTIGGGCAEASVREIALTCMRDNKAVLTTVDMSGKEAEDDGMVCGGVIEVYIDPMNN